jgi:G:T-mismatch repair DNA endonuclease (very short patch repair protein)
VGFRFFIDINNPLDNTDVGYIYNKKNTMKKELIDLILKDYKNGIGSTTLSKKYNVGKQKILKLLNDSQLIRKKDRCKKLNIIKEEEFYIIEKICPTCNTKSFIKTKESTTTCRNYYNTIKRGGNCKKCSLDLQKGIGNPFYGKKHTTETKTNISKSRKGKAMGESNSMAKYENRKKLSESLKKSWGSGNLEETRKKMSDTLKNTRRSGKLKSVIKSKKETEIFNHLTKMGYKVTSSYKIDTKICDIYIPKLNLIIEYFGDYWHCNPNKYSEEYINKKKNLSAKEIWEYDKMKLELIKSYGYNVEVIWENELKLNNQKLLTIIKKYDSK